MCVPLISTNVPNSIRPLHPVGIRQDRRIVQGGRRACLLLVTIGLSTTLYIDIGTFGGSILRPVQLVPLLFGTVAICLFPVRSLTGRSIAPHIILPAMYVVYLAIRHVGDGPEGILYVVKCLGNLVALWAVICLLGRIRRPEIGYSGIVLGVFISVIAGAVGAPVLGVDPHMGSGRWQGFMPGANRFGNICLLASLPLFGFAVCGQVKKSQKVFLIGLWLLCFGGIIMSGSRAVLGLALAGHFCLYVFNTVLTSRKVLRLKWVLTFGLTTCLVLGMVWVFYDSIPTRVLEFIEEGRISYTLYEDDARSDLHSIAFGFFQDAPVFGAGVEAERFEVVHDRNGFHQTSSHSTYLHLLSVSGGLGFVLFLLFPVWLMCELATSTANTRAKLSRTDRMSSMIALVVMLVLGLHATMISLANSMHVWVVFGVAAFVVLEMPAYRGLQPDGRQLWATQLRSKE